MEIGALLQTVAGQARVDDLLQKRLADLGWQLNESDDWKIFVTAIGELELLVRQHHMNPSVA